jgi:hypothetical protein
MMQDIRPAGFRQGYESHSATRLTDRQGLVGFGSGAAVRARSADRPVCPPLQDALLRCREPPLRADIVAKVESCRAMNFRENTKRKAITDSYGLNRIAEVACEFNVSR